MRSRTPYWEPVATQALNGRSSLYLALRNERVALGGTMIREAVIIAATPQQRQWLPRRPSGKQITLAGRRIIVKDMRLKTGLVNQERGMSWICNAHRCAAALAAIVIAATWCTGHARARDRRAEEVFTSCRPDVKRFCDHFTGRSDVDVAIFCLRDNFKNLRGECRRMMPTAAERNDGPRRRLNRLPIVLHRE